MIKKVLWQSIFSSVFLLGMLSFSPTFGKRSILKKTRKKKAVQKNSSLSRIKRKIINDRRKKKNIAYNRLLDKQKKIKTERESFSKAQLAQKEKLLKVVECLRRKKQLLEEKEHALKGNPTLRFDGDDLFNDAEWNIVKTYLDEK